MNPVKKALRETVVSPMYLQDCTLTTALLGDRVVLVGGLAL